MNSQRNTRVPFAQLSITELFLYLLAAKIAIELLCPWSPTEKELGVYLRQIWEEQNYTPADLVDFPSMSDRLKLHLRKYAAEASSISIPELPSRRRLQR
jgi:hypothetical protein